MEDKAGMPHLTVRVCCCFSLVKSSSLRSCRMLGWYYYFILPLLYWMSVPQVEVSSKELEVACLYKIEEPDG